MSTPDNLSPSLGARSDLIRLEPVVDLLHVGVWTGKVKGEKPVSMILIANQESAKSQCLMRFQNAETCQFLSDLTSKGISRYKPDIESGKTRHLVLLDLVRIVSHGRNVSDRTIQLLASLMEEGQSDISDAGGTETWKGMPNVGILTSITPDYFKSKKGRWRESGFLTRFLPIYYDYSKQAISEIHFRIRTGHRIQDAAKVKLPEKEKPVEIEAPEAAMIETLAITYGERLSVYAFRFHRALRTLAKASALMNNRRKVTAEDVAFLSTMMPFFSVEKPVAL